jgi:23S rRNA pseudouridine1911/1915/1917 synthase
MPRVVPIDAASRRPVAKARIAGCFVEPVLHRLVIDAAPERLDRALARALPDLSRSRLQALIREGQVRVEGHPVHDPSAKVGAGAAVEVLVPPPAPAEPAGESIALHVVYEDEDIIVIDKPAGLVVHPAAGHESGTLVNALIAHCGASLSGIGGVRRPGIVHRLDKDTSGLLVVAKNDAAHQGLSAQFADHGRTGPLKREYRALAWGVPREAKGTVEAALGRSPHNREKMAVVTADRGRHAVTHYAVLEALRAGGEAPLASLLACRLETGRTHQIRVHLAHLGHPLLGDATYGAGFRTKAARLPEAAREALADLGRQALHAAVLGFSHPRTGENLRFESPLPAALAHLLQALR